MLNYKGYYGIAEYIDEDGVFSGRVIGIQDTVTFRGESVAELRQSFQESIDVYLEYCAKLGHKPDKPVSGNFTVRIPQDLHRDIQIMAASAHKSLNAWITGLLEEARNRQRHQLPL